MTRLQPCVLDRLTDHRLDQEEERPDGETNEGPLASGRDASRDRTKDRNTHRAAQNPPREDSKRPGNYWVVTRPWYKELVRQDLERLLNTKALCLDPKEFPRASRSVLNYGIPDPTGEIMSRIDSDRLKEYIRSAIARFEPRISQLLVRVDAPSASLAASTIGLVIEGKLWAEPSPDYMLLTTVVELEGGHCEVKDSAGE